MQDIPKLGWEQRARQALSICTGRSAFTPIAELVSPWQVAENVKWGASGTEPQTNPIVNFAPLDKPASRALLVPIGCTAGGHFKGPLFLESCSRLGRDPPKAPIAQDRTRSPLHPPSLATHTCYPSYILCLLLACMLSAKLTLRLGASVRRRYHKYHVTYSFLSLKQRWALRPRDSAAAVAAGAGLSHKRNHAFVSG